MGTETHVNCSVRLYQRNVLKWIKAYQTLGTPLMLQLSPVTSPRYFFKSQEAAGGGEGGAGGTVCWLPLDPQVYMPQSCPTPPDPILTLMNPLSPQFSPQEFLINQYLMPFSTPQPTATTAWLH